MGRWEGRVSRKDNTAPARLPSGRQFTATEAERARAFKRARWNSRYVRILRVALPVLSVALLSSYGLFLNTRLAAPDDDAANAKFTFDGPEVSLTSAGLKNPKYEGFNKDGSRYVVTAARAKSDFRPGSPIQLEDINGQIFDLDGGATRLVSKDGVYDQKAGTLKLSNGIEIVGTNGLIAKLVTAEIATKAGTVMSRDPVEVSLPAGVVVARALDLDTKARTARFDDGVQARFKPPKPPDKAAANAKPASGKAKSAGIVDFGLGSGSDTPITITAKSLDVVHKENRARFQQNVRVVQDNVTITSDSLDVAFARAASDDRERLNQLAAGLDGSGGQLTSVAATGSVVLSQGDDQVKAAKAVFDAKAQTADLTGGVVMTRGRDRVTARQATFDTARRAAKLTGGVTITSPGDRTVVADQVTMNEAEGTAQLSGGVRVAQGRNRLAGHQLNINQNTGEMTLLPATGGPSAGRMISALLHREDARAGKTASGKAAAAAPSALGGVAFNTDPTAPIRIKARRLDVDDKRKRAVFSNDVVAKQGELTITAKKLTAGYTGSTQVLGGGNRSDGKRAATRGGETTLTRVIADGGVKIDSGGKQTAEGGFAVYDVAANTITLEKDVVLTQGRQVIRGTKMIIDVTSGLSRMLSAPAASVTNKGGKRERMRAVFYPSDLQSMANEARKAKKKQAKPNNDDNTSSWTATTRSGTN